MLSGLGQLNIELNSTCNKRTLCGFCGHQNAAIHPTRRDGEMDFSLVERLARELADCGKSLVVQFHRDGDPMAVMDLYLHRAMQMFRSNTRSIVTHGESLEEKGWALVNNCESVCVSIFRGDPDRDLQLNSLREFLAQKGDRLPRVYLKIVGDMGDDDLAPYMVFKLPLLSRRLHVPTGNTRYAGAVPPMPEHGLCLDLLHHPSVAWDGRVYLCNRLDTRDRGVIGDLATRSLDAIWNGPERAAVIDKHLHGKRHEVAMCADCTYYGVPTA